MKIRTLGAATAALAATAVHVRVGSLNRSSGGTKHGVASVDVHPNTDLTVLTLSTPIANPTAVSLAPPTRPSATPTPCTAGAGRASTVPPQNLSSRPMSP